MAFLVETLAIILLQLIVAVISFLGSALNAACSLNGTETLRMFFDTFTMASAAYSIFLYTAYGILYIIFMFQLFKVFFGPSSEAESPIGLTVKVILYSVLIANAQNLCAIIFEIATIPYKAIAALNSSSAVTQPTVADAVTNMLTPQTAVVDVAATAATAVLSATFLSGAMVGAATFIAIIILIFAIMLVQEYTKLILEVVERYVVLGLLTLIAPLCIAAGVSKATNKVFKSWFEMLISECIALVFNIFFLTVFKYSFDLFKYQYIELIIALMMFICWLRVGQKVDEHMGKLGLKVAQTGGFGESIFRSSRTAAGVANNVIGKVPGAKGGGQSGIIGAMKNASQKFGAENIAKRQLSGIKEEGLFAKQRTKIGQDHLKNHSGDSLGLQLNGDKKLTPVQGIRSSTIQQAQNGVIPPLVGKEAGIAAARATIGDEKLKELKDKGFDITDGKIDSNGMYFAANNGSEFTSVRAYEDVPKDEDPSKWTKISTPDGDKFLAAQSNVDAGDKSEVLSALDLKNPDGTISNPATDVTPESIAAETMSHPALGFEEKSIDGLPADIQEADSIKTEDGIHKLENSFEAKDLASKTLDSINPEKLGYDEATGAILPLTKDESDPSVLKTADGLNYNGSSYDNLSELKQDKGFSDIAMNNEGSIIGVNETANGFSNVATGQSLSKELAPSDIRGTSSLAEIKNEDGSTNVVPATLGKDNNYTNALTGQKIEPEHVVAVAEAGTSKMYKDSLGNEHIATKDSDQLYNSSFKSVDGFIPSQTGNYMSITNDSPIYPGNKVQIETDKKGNAIKYTQDGKEWVAGVSDSQSEPHYKTSDNQYIPETNIQKSSNGSFARYENTDTGKYVKDMNGDYRKVAGNTMERYDESGKASPIGNYVKVSTATGSVETVPVMTRPNASIPTFTPKEISVPLSYDEKTASISPVYNKPIEGIGGTHINVNGNMRELAPEAYSMKNGEKSFNYTDKKGNPWTEKAGDRCLPTINPNDSNRSINYATVPKDEVKTYTQAGYNVNGIITDKNKNVSVMADAKPKIIADGKYSYESTAGQPIIVSNEALYTKPDASTGATIKTNYGRSIVETPKGYCPFNDYSPESYGEMFQNTGISDILRDNHVNVDYKKAVVHGGNKVIFTTPEERQIVLSTTPPYNKELIKGEYSSPIGKLYYMDIKKDDTLKFKHTNSIKRVGYFKGMPEPKDKK